MMFACVERLDGSDVGPVAVVQIGAHAMRAERGRDDLAPEIGDRRVLQQSEQHVAREHVDAHRRDERLLVVVESDCETAFRAARCCRSPPAARGSAFPRTPRSARRDRNRKMPHRRRVLRRHRQRGDRDVGVLVDVRVEHPPVVHAIEMIAGENQVVVGVVSPEVPRRLPHRVGRALKPARAVRRLLGRDDVDEAVRERIHAIASARRDGSATPS